MAKRIVIASGKGGVGKSTTAAGLGKALAKQGVNTLLIDCDAGLASLDTMLGCREFAAFGWYDVFSGSCAPADAVTKVFDKLSLISAPASTVGTDSKSAVKELVKALDGSFDVIITDSPAGLGTGVFRAAAAADYGLIIATGDEISVRGAAAVDEKLREAGVSGTRLIINRYDLKAAKKGRLMSVDEIIDASLVRLIGIIPEDDSLLYRGTKSKKNIAVGSFDRIAHRIMGKNVELKLTLLK